MSLCSMLARHDLDSSACRSFLIFDKSLGRHLHLPRHRRVCRLCHTGALGDERHMLLECPALADLRDKFSTLVVECSGVMARLAWAKDQLMVSRYIVACLDRMSC